MSDYLVNLARRAAGIAPVARPRSVPGPGPIPGPVRGAEPASPPPSPVRSASDAGTDPSTTRGDRGSTRVSASDDQRTWADGVAPLGPAVDSAGRLSRGSGPSWRDEPRRLRIAEPAAAVERAPDPPTATVSPGGPTPTGSGLRSPAETHEAIADHAPEARRDPDPARTRSVLEPRRDDITVQLPLPAASDGARRTDASWLTVVEPALAPAPLGGPHTVIEARLEREVHVRIGTIEIHTASDGPAPASLPPAAAPAAAAMPVGGFDEFVRLRTYAPWER